LLQQALDTEALQSDGIDLALVEQMNELALQEAASLEGVKETARAFDVSIPSTKVRRWGGGELHYILYIMSILNIVSTYIISQY